MHTENDIIKLSILPIGRKAVLMDVEENALLLQLMGMGCMPGENVEIVRKAVFGNPIAIDICGNHLSIREEDADKIIVKLIAE